MWCSGSWSVCLRLLRLYRCDAVVGGGNNLWSTWFGLPVLISLLKSCSSASVVHQLFLISFLHLPWSMTSSLLNLRALQSFHTTSLQFSKCSFVYLLVCYPPLHTPYISSPNQCLPFTTRDHIIAVTWQKVNFFRFCLTNHSSKVTPSWAGCPKENIWG